jgi:metabotropic X receptor
LFHYQTGVIVFGSDQEVAELMNAVKRRNATGQFYWIGSDGWAARALVYNGKLVNKSKL